MHCHGPTPPTPLEHALQATCRFGPCYQLVHGNTGELSNLLATHSGPSASRVLQFPEIQALARKFLFPPPQKKKPPHPPKKKSPIPPAEKPSPPFPPAPELL